LEEGKQLSYLARSWAEFGCPWVQEETQSFALETLLKASLKSL